MMVEATAKTETEAKAAAEAETALPVAQDATKEDDVGSVAIPKMLRVTLGTNGSQHNSLIAGITNNPWRWSTI